MFDSKKDAMDAVLRNAAEENMHELITEMIRDGAAEINEKNERGETALHAAVRGKAFEAASVLIKHGADVNATDHAEATPMYWAAVFDASEIMLLLLENGVRCSSVFSAKTYKNL